MNILIVGAGMYVSGGDTSNNGTVISAIIQSSKSLKLNNENFETNFELNNDFVSLVVGIDP